MKQVRKKTIDLQPVIFKMVSSVAGSRLAARVPSGYPVPGSASVKGTIQLAKAKDALMRLYGKDWKYVQILKE